MGHTFHCWHLVASQNRKVGGGPGGGLEVLEKPAGRNRALADSGSSSREKRDTSSREEEEGLSQQGRG